MSSYRIYKYPMRKVRFRHIYFKFDLRLGALEETVKRHTKLEKLKADERFDQSLSRSRRTVRDLILCNLFQYFCTFTFSPEKVDRYDYAACKKKITKIFARYRDYYSPNFRYLLVPERHKDGAWHFHGMVSGIRPEDFTTPATIWIHPRKDSEELKEVPNIHGYVDWSYYSKKLGFFNCSLIRQYERCASYVSKYITKDLAKIETGKQVVLASKNLNRPELVFDCDDVPCEFTPEFEDDFCKIAWKGDDFTMGRYLTPWDGECCSDLRDPLPDIYETPEETRLFIPLTGEQLRLGSRRQEPLEAKDWNVVQ